MYLKSIEIQGFKSFANRILFRFEKGVTGIVGPNGSGKSNVADAVRWVLGEQSAKQLRGGSMQDVIFSGTETRKPQGFAYVAITFDNTDHVLNVSYDEVTVSRRLYRSGESEYRINGSACRLRDINELFYDTGIGKEGYSMIGQGQVDQILSGKPEERRALLDEAAGIVKFRRRKDEAQKKLDDEQANLVRITDILSELEKRVGPLEAQAKKAKEYLSLRDELKVYDVNLFLTETKTLREQYAEMEKREKTAEASLDEAKKAADEKRAEHEKLAEETEALDQKIASMEADAKEKELRIQSAMGRVDVLREQIANENQAAGQVNDRLASVRKDREKREAEKEAALAEQEVFRKESAESAEKLAAAEKELAERDETIGQKEKEIESLKSEIIQSLGRKAEISAEKQRYGTKLEETIARKKENGEKIGSARNDRIAGGKELAEKEEKLGLTAKNLAEKQREAAALREKSAEEEQKIRDLNRDLSSAQQDYHISSTKRESLRNLAERYDGYGNAIRRVMEQKNRVPGIYGVVADIISTGEKYETAIETALGGQIQNIVTDSEGTAKRMIAFLKEGRYGRATFLPLTSVRGRSGSENSGIKGEKGVIGMADTLVRTEPRYRGVISQLLGRTVVADTIDNAIALNRAHHYSLRIVTLEGELLNPGGSLTGGAFRNSSNLLGRKRELEELDELCGKALEKVEKVQKALVRAEEEHVKTGQRLSDAAEAEQSLTIEKKQLQFEVGQARERDSALSSSAEQLESESETLAAREVHFRELREKSAGEEAEIDRRNEELSEQTDNLSDELAALRRKRADLESQLSGQRVEDTRLRQKGEYLRENLARAEKEIRDLSAEEQELLDKNSGRGGRIREKQDEIEKVSRSVEELRTELAELRKECEEKRAERIEKAGKQKNFFDEKERLDDEIRLLDRDLLRIQNQLEKDQEKITQKADYIRAEYEMEYADAEKLRDETLGPVTQLRREIGAKKAKIRDLGNVNVNAIEEYKEVSERCAFMEKQHADIKAAEAALEKIIGELDEGMRRQFSEKFREISEQFDEVFKELFGGGTATLRLEEGVDVLEAGIGIIAQPPGKKLQNMMQLSGGEKALTAISLLFAIQNLKPSPFCLLDEIESALDDSNVDRFANYLHKLTAHTQFIVITHRRGTMLGCDQLYGITMQEKGVSTMVSVSLIEADLDKADRRD